MTHTKGFLAAFRLSCQQSFTSESCSPFEFLPQTTVCHQQPAYQLGRHANSTSGGLVARAPSSWRVCSRVSPVPVLPCQSQVGVCQVRFPLPASWMLGSCLHQQGPVQLAGQDQVRGLCYLRASPSLLTFKAKLKSNLFRQALWLICTRLLLSCLILSPSVFWWRTAQARSLWTSTNTVHLMLHASCCWCHRTSGNTWKQLFNTKGSCSCRRCDKGWVLQELEKIVLAATV